jgi:hypothetical protein
MCEFASSSRQSCLGKIDVGPLKPDRMPGEVSGVVASLLAQAEQKPSMPNQIFGHRCLTDA